MFTNDPIINEKNYFDHSVTQGFVFRHHETCHML